LSYNISYEQLNRDKVGEGHKRGPFRFGHHGNHYTWIHRIVQPCFFLKINALRTHPPKSLFFMRKFFAQEQRCRSSRGEDTQAGD
jgi:hypothetical protein